MNDQKLINGKDTKGKEKHKLLIFSTSGPFLGSTIIFIFSFPV